MFWDGWVDFAQYFREGLSYITPITTLMEQMAWSINLLTAAIIRYYTILENVPKFMTNEAPARNFNYSVLRIFKTWSVLDLMNFKYCFFKTLPETEFRWILVWRLFRYVIIAEKKQVFDKVCFCLKQRDLNFLNISHNGSLIFDVLKC